MTVAPAFLAECSARLAGSGLHLRAAGESDAALLAALYATARAAELALLPWSTDQKRAFTESQSRAQEQHYALHHPGFERLLVESAQGVPIGRIYVETTPRLVHLLDILLVPASRGKGGGTRLMEELLSYADARRLPVSLYVEPENPARRLYVRLGFEAFEVVGFYQRMERPPLS